MKDRKIRLVGVARLVLSSPGAVDRERRIVEHFDARLFAPLLVVRRGPGNYLVIDGRDRVGALRRMGRRVAPCRLMGGA